MNYRVNIFGLFFTVEDHLYRIRKAETFKNHWKVFLLLMLGSVVIYTWMAFLGIGTNFISEGAVALNASQYAESKFWFVLGRVCFAVLLALLILFLPPFYFQLFTDIPYRKLLIMQEVVLSVILIERITWVPLAVFFGLDWFVSPFSFGILAAYVTEISWVIYFFGAVSLFQLWIIWFQVRYLASMSSLKKSRIWLSVMILHLLYWTVTAYLSFIDVHLIGGWFN